MSSLTQQLHALVLSHKKNQRVSPQPALSMAMQERPLCFVCLEEGTPCAPVKRRCLCNTAVHDACLVRTMMSVRSHSLHCAICKSEYKNVKTVTQTVLRFDHRLFFSTVSLFSMISLTFLFFQILRMHSPSSAHLNSLMGLVMYMELLCFVWGYASWSDTSDPRRLTLVSFLCLRRATNTLIVVD